MTFQQALNQGDKLTPNVLTEVDPNMMNMIAESEKEIIEQMQSKISQQKFKEIIELWQKSTDKKKERKRIEI